MTRPSSRSRPLVSRFLIALLVLGLWGGLPGLSHGGAYWFDNEFARLLRVHHCEQVTQSQKDYPFHELLTDVVFVTWCYTPPPDPPVSQYGIPLFHLIVLTRESTHPWARCPKFIRLDNIADSTHLWMEQPTQMRGNTLSLHDLAYLDIDPVKPLRRGPKGIQATGPSLWSGERGDISWFLYCYQGAWLSGGEGD